MNTTLRRCALAAVSGLLSLSATSTATATASAARSAPAPLAAQQGSQVTAARFAPQTFAHPGVSITSTQLEFVRTKVQQGAAPWKAAYDDMVGDPLASLSRVPAPRPVVNCGQSSNPNNGCTDERQDAIAAYTDALAWAISGDERYAQKSIQIMDAWSSIITSHTGANTGIQTAWSAASWVKAAELIKYQYLNWPNVGRFASMLRSVYLPVVVNGDDRTATGTSPRQRPRSGSPSSPTTRSPSTRPSTSTWNAYLPSSTSNPTDRHRTAARTVASTGSRRTGTSPG
ncbi:alginate lyase family protein [Streptomyces sviceus]